MTATTAQNATQVPEAPPEPVAVTAPLASLTTSAEPAVVLTSLAALCVPSFIAAEVVFTGVLDDGATSLDQLRPRPIGR